MRKEKSITREPSTKRKRLHLLYLLNDILYHCKFRVNDASVCSKIQPMLVNLIGSAASFKRCPKHQKKIQDLLDLWEEKSYYSREYIDKLREAIKNASEAGQYDDSGTAAEINEGQTIKNTKSAPYVMPAMHGDASTPWFDLPAGNLLPYIIPNSTRPINPDLIKPLQFVAGPAEERLALAVKELLDDADIIYGAEKEQDDKMTWDIDELGQLIIQDEITGDVIDGEGYYGWSRSFCEKMKRRKNGPDPPSQDQARRSRSTSSSPGRRKRRYSDESSSPGGFRSTRRRRSYSSSRSPSPVPGRRNGHSRRQSRSRSYSRSPPPSRPSEPPRSLPQPRENLPPRPPIPQGPSAPFHSGGFNQIFPPPPPPIPYPQAPYPQAPHSQAPYSQVTQWPPPPQMQNMQNMPYNPQAPQFGHGQWPPPPPPPPPGPPPMNSYQPQQQQQQQQQQHGGQYPPSGPGGWQQQQSGRGYNGANNGGWNNAPRGRGGYRGGRGW